MPLDQMDHYSIRTTKLDETKEFYERVLGLKNGARPPLNFPGYWLYIGDRPVIHLIGIDEDDPSGLIDYLGDVDLEKLDGSGAVDHLAFRASKADDMKHKLEEMGVPFREREIPELDLRQMFLEDPNNVTIEINYYGLAKEGAKAA